MSGAAGASAVQELALILATRSEYEREARTRGLHPEFTFILSGGSEFLEEIAKYRAAEFPFSVRLSFPVNQTENNIVRATLQALAAFLGGAQSVVSDELDPTMLQRIAQVIEHESGILTTADPLAGSCYLEERTRDIRNAAKDLVRRIDELGGLKAAIERGFPQREIATRHHNTRIVGEEELWSAPSPAFSVIRPLENLSRAAEGTDNLTPYILAERQSHATLEEISVALSNRFGAWRQPPLE